MRRTLACLAMSLMAGCSGQPAPIYATHQDPLLMPPPPKPPVIIVPAKPRVITRTKTVERPVVRQVPVETVIEKPVCAAQHLVVPTIDDERAMSASLRQQIADVNQAIAKGCPVR